ncbi:Polysaccharide transport protein [Dissulfuribacter thermophilus]|uniref:Polysaccharide transport protein n=1 Tax=Dissulfuribacter thermophilus TaxID=1156395 RepID=A0A1B9F6Q3_9BACT|nr:O-antigen ligase family protein [Dissulfuribacter thermophilus]OCC15638.1 Polysaccharide transport protein [Dissulfuribacter thermophilus]
MNNRVWSIDFILYIAILIFCPLAFGTVETWSKTVMEFLVPVALSILLLRILLKKDGPWLGVPGATPLFLLLIYMLFQAIPLPPALQGLISPSSQKVYSSLEILSGHYPSLPLTVNLHDTLKEFFRIATYCLFYLLTVNLLRRYSRLKVTLSIVAGLVGVIAFFAILQKFTAHDRIYWFRTVPANALPVGPWVYHNHFAGFMEMLIPLTVAMFLYYRPNVSYKTTLRQKVVEFLTFPTANRHILLGFSGILGATSLFLSLSRGGIISFLLSFLIFVFLIGRKNKRIRGILPVVAIILLFVLEVTWFGWDPIVERFNKMFNEEGRLFDGRFKIWQDCVKLIKDFWLCGAGFGTFEHIFPLYREKMDAAVKVSHAHNDYIEILTDGGIIGLILIGCFLASIMMHGWRRIQGRRDIFSIYIFIGAFCGILAILFHSFTDFNMHNGANGLYFFFLCGVMVSAANVRRFGKKRKNLLKQGRLPGAVFVLSLALIVLGARFNVGQIISNNIFDQISRIYLNPHIPQERLLQMRASIQKAIEASPFEARNHFAAANIDAFLLKPAQTMKEYRDTLWLEPTNSDFLMRVGLYVAQLNYDTGNSLIKLAIQYDNLHADLRLAYARWLFEQGRMDEGLEELKIAMSQDPSRLKDCIALLMLYGMDARTMERILPDKAQLYLKLASYLDKAGKKDTAAKLYRKALNKVDNEEKIRPWYFITPYWFFMRHQMYDEALFAINQGIRYLPNNSRIRLRAGDLYRRLGLVFRAKEEYRQVLVIDPNNSEAKRKLKLLNQK